MNGPLRCHRVAGHQLLSDCLTAALPADPTVVRARSWSPTATDDQVVFRGIGLVAGADRMLSCSSGSGGLLVAVDGIGSFQVSSDGSVVCCREVAPDVAAATVAEAALGPAAMLALALHGTFSLHASAVAVGDACVGFVGPSGAGKSTVARLLDRHPGPCRRVADDILPISSDPTGPLARLDFPQPKVAAAELAGMQRQSALPLVAVYCVTAAGGAANEVTVTELTAATGALELLHSTVAARLFPPGLRVRHLEWCAALAERIPVVRLAYPWTGEVSDELADLVVRAADGTTLEVRA